MNKQKIGEGDSYVIDNILPPDLAARAFNEISTQTSWNNMFHKGGAVPRLISIQGEPGKGRYLDGPNEQVDYFPLYRHPADTQLACTAFLPVVSEIAAYISSVLNQKFNHALVQYYRTGDDIITEHSDKTLDIADDSVIVNVSLGYTRTMTLRTKKANGDSAERRSAKIVLADNSLFVLGPDTNRKWLHGIRADKTDVGRSEGSGRISLTFRSIRTYSTTDGKHIFGQGVDSQESSNSSNTLRLIETKDGETYQVATVVDSTSMDDAKVSALYMAFSTENKNCGLTRREIYGEGSNVIT